MPYVIKVTKNDKFSFSLKAMNHEIILTSQIHGTKAAALAGIASVQKHGPDEANFELKKSSSDQPYFILKAANHQTIGTSEMYSSEAAARNGIASVQKNSSSTDIKEA